MAFPQILAVDSLIATRKRFIIPVLVITVVRTVYAYILYHALRAGPNFSVPFMSIWNFKLPYDWLYLFSAWDSGAYQTIAVQWYPATLSPYWSYFPLYPATFRLLSVLGIDPALGAFLVSATCGLASTVAFQGVAEGYFDRRDSLVATSLYFLFPPVFVFSAASYPESLFLLLSLLSWYLHRKQKELQACLAAGLCSLSRPEGVLMVIPLVFDYLKRGQLRKLPYLMIPLSVTVGWELYGFVLTDVWLPTRAAGIFWNTANAQAVKRAVQQLFQGDLSSIAILLPYSGLIVAIVVILVVVVFLAWRNWKIDKALCSYILASTFLLGVSTSIAYRSFPRILSFFFPIGLALHTRNLKLLVTVVLLFLALDYAAWLAFLTDGFY